MGCRSFFVPKIQDPPGAGGDWQRWRVVFPCRIDLSCLVCREFPRPDGFLNLGLAHEPLFPPPASSEPLASPPPRSLFRPALPRPSFSRGKNPQKLPQASISTASLPSGANSKVLCSLTTAATSPLSSSRKSPPSRSSTPTPRNAVAFGTTSRPNSGGTAWATPFASLIASRLS